MVDDHTQVRVHVDEPREVGEVPREPQRVEGLEHMRGQRGGDVNTQQAELNVAGIGFRDFLEKQLEMARRRFTAPAR